MSFNRPADVRRHELLADVAEQTARRLIERHALDEGLAVDVGNALADFLAEHWKGQNVYIVGDQAYKLAERDWEIFRRMERGNAHELAKEYGISYIRVYQIHKRCLAEYRRRTQPDLFTTPPQVADQPAKTEPSNGV